MNILFVSGHDPRDTSFGSSQRTNLLWKALHNIGDVYAICYYQNDCKLTDKIVASRFISPTGWKGFINRIINKLWFWWDKDALKIYPYGYEFTFTNPFGNIKFDTVVCRYIDPAVILHLWNIAPLYLDLDDDPIQAFKTRDALRLPKWKRPIALLLLKMIVRIAKHKMTAGWIANPEQASTRWKRPLLPLSNIPQYPSTHYNPQTKREQYLFSVGYMGYSPNYWGVETFIHEIWIPLHRLHPDLQYWIIGKDAPKKYADKWNHTPGVRYMGFVTNLESIYEKALATVVAVNSGSGTCIKALESLAHSRVCLSTQFGVRGLTPKNDFTDCGFLVFHSFYDFMTLLEKYIFNQKEREIIEKKALNYCKSNYSTQNFNEEVKIAFAN